VGFVGALLLTGTYPDPVLVSLPNKEPIFDKNILLVSPVFSSSVMSILIDIGPLAGNAIIYFYIE
jgi:hypothetical protein